MSTADEINARREQARHILRSIEDQFLREVFPVLAARLWWLHTLEVAKMQTRFALAYDPCDHRTLWGDGSGWECVRCRQIVNINGWIKAWRAPKGAL